MEVFNNICEAIVEGNIDKVKQFTQAAVSDGHPGEVVLNEGLLPGMDVVGSKMKSGDLFIPEVLMSAKAMQEGLDLLLPLMEKKEGMTRGKIVIGTVEGDLHDIGKNLVCMMLRGAGFEVIDLGINVTATAFVEALKSNNADILGMSALLTTTMPKMEETVNAVENAGMRNKVKIMAGGAPVTQAFVDKIKADRFAPDAATAVDCAKEMMKAN